MGLMPNNRDDINDSRLEGLRIIGARRPLDYSGGFTRKTFWAVTVAKLYMGYLRSGREPEYPKEPTDYLSRV